MTPETIKRDIQKGLPEAEIQIEGDGSHFFAIVIDARFQGKTRIERQLMVYDTVKPQLLAGDLHALSVKTFTREEWNKLNAAGTESNG